MNIRARHLIRPLWMLSICAVLAACATTPPPPPQPSLRAEQQAVLRDLGFAEADDGGWLMTIAEPISFEFNKSELRDPLREELQKMARQLLDVKIDHVRCEGHTDSTGAHEYNKNLSLARAQAVADVFLGNGFSPANVSAIGHASDYPIADNGTREGRAANRRVDVIVPALVLSVE